MPGASPYLFSLFYYRVITVVYYRCLLPLFYLNHFRENLKLFTAGGTNDVFDELHVTAP